MFLTPCKPLPHTEEIENFCCGTVHNSEKDLHRNIKNFPSIYGIMIEDPSRRRCDALTLGKRAWHTPHQGSRWHATGIYRGGDQPKPTSSLRKYRRPRGSSGVIRHLVLQMIVGQVLCIHTVLPCSFFNCLTSSAQPGKSSPKRAFKV